MIDLDELERRCTEATPGPWTADAWSDHEAEVYGYSISAGGCLLPLSDGTGELDEAEANASLIAALRNAAPELIAMARRYQTKREMDFESSTLRYIAEDDDEIERLRRAHHASYDAAIDAAMKEQER